MGSTTTTNGTHPEGMAAYAGPSLFQPHRTRQAIRDAYEKKIPPMIGYYAGLSAVPLVRFMAPMGYDAVWIDWEHTPCDVETMTTMVHETLFMSQGRTIPWVRVPGHDHAAIGYALDAGANLVIPQVETVEQAKHVVSAAKYGTKQNGTRSAPPFRLIPGLTDMCVDPTRDIHMNVNDQAAIMIQIESIEAIKNLDAILTEVPDIDVVWLGSLDCRVSMNLHARPTGEPEPEWLAAVELFESTLKKHKKPKSGFCLSSGDELRKAAEDMVLVFPAADVLKLMSLYQDLLGFRAAVAPIAKK